MNKIKIQKDGSEQFVKPRFLNRFLDSGWSVVEEKVSKVAKAKVKATADVIGEEETPQIEEENSSMSNHNEGED